MIQPAAFSREEAATYLGVSVDTIDRLRADGRLTAFRAGGRLIRFARFELDDFMRRECLTASSTSSSRSEAPRAGISSGSNRDTRDDLRRARQIAMKLRAS